jgi:hypothetical protein
VALKGCLVYMPYNELELAYQVFKTAVAAAFEYVDKAHQIAVDIGVWVIYGVAYTSLGSKVDHHIKLVLGK